MIQMDDEHVQAYSMVSHARNKLAATSSLFFPVRERKVTVA